MPDEVYIGLDLGGTRIRAGRYTGKLIGEQRVETLTLDEEGPDAVIGRMVDMARQVWPTNGDVVAGVGVSAPGPVDIQSGIITAPPNLYGWHNVPLKARLESALNVPVYLGNDANLAALAEYQMGAGRGYRHLIYITVSTGVGAGVISDEHLIVGARGFGAECGHLILVLNEGGTDRVSSLEKEAAGPALARQAVAAMQAGEMSSILQLAGSYEAVEGKHVVMAAQAGDALGLRIVRRAGWILGLGIINLLHTFNPEIVVIGGGVAQGAGELLFDPMWETIRRPNYAVLDSSYWEDLKIVGPALGEDVSLIGAAALALRKGR
jgi:glucokinase